MDALIVAGLRSPVTKADKGSLRNQRSDDLAVEVVRKLLLGFPEISKEEIDDVIVGCALPEGSQGLQIGRQISLRTFGKEVPGVTVNRYCGSGLEAIAIATAKIRAGMAECIIAGGTESMSSVPMTGHRFAPSYEVAKNTPDYIISMGLTAEAVAEKYNISRDDQDEFAYNSHQKAANAIRDDKFKFQITPISFQEAIFSSGEVLKKEVIVEKDEGVRPETTPEALAGLKPVFQKNGTVTAGNSSQRSDGAAFVIIASEEFINNHNISAEARLLSCSLAGVDPKYMGMGPVKAIPKALKAAGVKGDDLKWIELNEAFAAQSLGVIREADLNEEILNPYGGAIALGHPLGCTGTKLSLQLIDGLANEGGGKGIVTACIGGGQGIAGVYEVF